MKKITLIITIFFTSFIYSQDYTNVLDLLINNKRSEARKLYDKQFDKIKTNNIDLLFLDAMIDFQLGKSDFDESFIKNLEKLPNAEMYIAPFINFNFILDDISDQYYNDLTYKKIDFLAQSEKFKNLPIVRYRKAYFDMRRYKIEDSNKKYNEFGAIKKWQFCSAFENLNSSGLLIEYEPETYAKNDKIFDANSNGKVGWYSTDKEQSSPYFFFMNEAQFGNGIIYAQTFIECKEKKSYKLNFGANNGIKIFLNNKEIYLNDAIKNSNLDGYAIKINLEKGYNRLLFKLEMKSASDYLSAQIKNLDNTNTNDLQYSNIYKDYPINNSEVINSDEIPLDFEKYFDSLVSNNPKNILYKIYQFMAYQCNGKKDKAFQCIEGLDEKYPNSTLISTFFIKYYSLLDDENQKIKEIQKKIETVDADSYLNVLNKISDKEWLGESKIEELEQYKEKSKLYQQKYMEHMFDFMIASKKSDIDGMLNIFHNLSIDSYNNEQFLVIEANLWDKLKNDKTKYKSILEKLYKEREVFDAGSNLMKYYNDSNDKDAVKKILTDRIKTYPSYNYFRNSYIEVLLNESKYEEAQKIIDENLSYFPYSFSDFERKADVYNLMKRNKDAEEYIRKYLVLNSGNTKLRKQLYDITKTPDEIESVETKDIYKFVKENRNSKMKTDYGVVTLLDQYIVNIFPESGRKSKVTYLYEITAENGIEELKEFSLDLYNNTILKSEIIKSDGTIIPAEKGDNLLVFANLKIGDVIYIDYEKHDNSTGRFFKDFDVTNYFNSTYPVANSVFSVIVPENYQYNINYLNGVVPSVTKKINSKIARIWTQKNVQAIALLENYSANYADITNRIDIGTIKSWSEISSWYSDLVQKSLRTDKITTTTFNEIFKNGITGLTDEQKAKMIYAYIENNIKYSSLDFRQSGFVPQKPSKTITTKLGDCKDVSTLFVALSNIAGLKSNLVLVLTNDKGFNTMPLPTNEFNHCIVRVMIDNVETFLELTDKYLPFRALPSSLFKANALVISFDKTQKSELIKIPFNGAIECKINSTTTVSIDEKEKKFVSTETVQGATKAYYNELYSPSTTDDIRTKAIEEDFNGRLKKIIKLDSSKVIQNEIFEKDITFENQFTIAEKLQTVGNLKITDIPFLNKIFTRDIISNETRKYDINYYKYENYNSYDNTIILNIPENKKFTEIPTNKSLKYKNKTYNIEFELVKQNSLKITRKATTPWDDISVADYPEFKKYVESIIEIEEQIIGFTN